MSESTNYKLPYYSELDFPFNPNKYYDFSFGYHTNCKRFQFNNFKYQVNIDIDIILKPKALLSQYIQALLAKNISEITTSEILNYFISTETEIVRQALNSEERELEFTNFIINIEKYISKQIIKEWKTTGNNSIIINSEHKKIF